MKDLVINIIKEYSYVTISSKVVLCGLYNWCILC